MARTRDLADEVLRDIPSEALEDWLKSEVATAYDYLKANPSSAITADKIRARTAAEREKFGE